MPSVRPADASSCRARAIARHGSTRRRCGRVPPAIPRRDRSVEWRRSAQVHRVDDGLAVNATRQGLPELLPRHPRSFAWSQARRPQIEREEIRVERDAHVDHLQATLIREALEGSVVLRTDVAVAHQVSFRRLEAQGFRVLVRHDRKRQTIEIRQLHARGIAAEVVGVARKDEALACDVFNELKGAEADDIGDRPGRGPGVLELAGGQEWLEDVLRQDRKVIEKPETWRERLGKADDHGASIRCRHVEWLAVDREGRRERAGDSGIVGHAKREQDVCGRQRCAVGELDVGPERDRVGQPVG